DADRRLWHAYGCEGWTSLFLWKPGGALAWVHFGEGEYRASEEAIPAELREQDALRPLPDPMDPLRPTDAPGARVMPPSEELFPGDPEEDQLKISYEAGGAYATVEGEGEIAIELDGSEVDPITTSRPALYTLAEHPRHESHRLTLRPSQDLRIWSISFAAGVPPAGGTGLGSPRGGARGALPRDRTRGPGTLRGSHFADFLGQHEAHVLVEGAQLGDVLGSALAEGLNQALDQLLGGACTGGDPHRLYPRQPLLLHLGVVVDQGRGSAVSARPLDRAVGVGGVGRADHQDQVALAGKLFDGDLGVGGRVADVVGLGADDRRELGSQGGDDLGGLVDREGRLGDEGDPLGIGDI